MTPITRFARTSLTRSSGVDDWDVDIFGSLALLPDPDEALRRAGIGREALRVLEYDDEINSALDTRREAVLSRAWRIEPAPESGAAGEAAAARMWAHLEPRIDDLLRGLWDAVPYGYSVVELVYDYDTVDGALLPVRMLTKDFERYTPTREGGLMHMRHGVSVPVSDFDRLHKYVLTRRQATERQPYGEALLSRLYWPYFLRSECWKMWARYLERHGSPTLVGKIELPEINRMLSPEDVARMDDVVGQMLDALRDELDRSVRSATIATTADIDALAPGNAGESFALFANEMAKRIQKVILGQTLTTDVQGGGSYAAAKVHDMVRKDRRDADLRLLTPGVQHVIDAAARLNGWPTPVFAFADAVDLQSERAERDATLAQAGIAAYTLEYLERTYDYEPGDLRPVPTGAPSVPVQAAARRFAAVPARARFTAQQEEVETLGDALVQEAAQPLDPDAIRAAIRGARTPDDLRDRLVAIMDRQDPRFAELLAQAQFAASVMGYLHAEGVEGVAR